MIALALLTVGTIGAAWLYLTQRVAPTTTTSTSIGPRRNVRGCHPF